MDTQRQTPLTWGRVEWMVDKVGDKSSKSPVVATILWQSITGHKSRLHITMEGGPNLEQVTQWHCGMGEAVDEQCL